MKYLPCFLILLFLFSCGENTDHSKMVMDLKMDWENIEYLNDIEVKYIFVSSSPFLESETEKKNILGFIHPENEYSLNRSEIKQLSYFLADSSNFTQGECGTFALNGGFVFLRKDTIKALINMGCGHVQWNANPQNKNTMGGNLSDKGFKTMAPILDSIFIKRLAQPSANGTD